ncbi:MAG: beta-ketoacyl-ACP synthase II, partial [Deltaproteobacteria bacterium]|nr:beta-ketoacyl-ACP synthase II [Deltaproteobacteria bacterium]
MNSKRVVVTGIGVITPLGVDIQSSWDRIKKGESGIDYITKFDPSKLALWIGGEVKGFQPEKFMEAKEIKRTDIFVQYSLAAATMALNDSDLNISENNAHRVGVVVGTALAGIKIVEHYHKVLLNKGHQKVTPFFIPMLLGNMASGKIAIMSGAKGPNTCLQTACAAGTHAIGDAFRIIQRGQADAVITGGTESTITPFILGAFKKMKAISKRNDFPQRASRPFDKNRDGFVVAEGAGILILEELETALKRNARIYAEIIGYGFNGDAYHITAPPPKGEIQAKCIQMALKDASIDPDEVDYINAHGTSTPANDVAETRAIKLVFKKHSYNLAVSSTKSMIGHLLGAAGGVEAVFAALSLYEGIIPPTINYETPDPECDLDYVPNETRHKDIHIALSNSFGFGGANG